MHRIFKASLPKTITEDNTIQFENGDLISITDVDAETSELRVTLVGFPWCDQSQFAPTT